MGIGFRYSGSDICGRAEEYSSVVSAFPLKLARERWRAPSGDDESANDGYQHHQPLMLSHGIKTMEGVQKVIPATVGSECFNRNAISLTEPPFASCALDPGRWTVKFIDGFEYRKAGGSAWFYVVACGERCGKYIEAAADRVYDHARFDIETKIGRPRTVDYNKSLSGVGI
jgi:hypothetical protein